MAGFSAFRPYTFVRPGVTGEQDFLEIAATCGCFVAQSAPRKDDKSPIVTSVLPGLDGTLTATKPQMDADYLPPVPSLKGWEKQQPTLCPLL